MRYLLLLLAVIIMAPESHALGIPIVDPKDETYAHDFHVALRTDSPANPQGTEDDPFDGSTPAKLAAVMASIPPDSSITFGPGVFQTDTIIVLKDHWAIRGSGMHATTLQATPTLLQRPGGTMMLSARNLPSSLVVEDIGFDGNFPDPTAGPWSIRAMQLTVGKATVQRCYIKNFSCGLNQEMFIVFLGPDYSPTSPVPGWGIARHNVIEKCASSDGYLDGIAISGGWTGYTGIIERNIFRVASVTTGMDIAWNLLWCDVSSISNNISFGGCFNSDFGGTNSFHMRHNAFLDLRGQRAGQIGGGTVDPTLYPLATCKWRGVVIEDNLFELNGGPFQAGVQIGDNVVKAIVQRNIFKGASTNKYILNERDQGTTTLLLRFNLVDPVLTGSSIWSTPGSVTLLDNIWFDGTPFPTP